MRVKIKKTIWRILQPPNRASSDVITRAIKGSGYRTTIRSPNRPRWVQMRDSPIIPNIVISPLETIRIAAWIVTNIIYRSIGSRWSTCCPIGGSVEVLSWGVGVGWFIIISSYEIDIGIPIWCLKVIESTSRTAKGINALITFINWIVACATIIITHSPTCRTIIIVVNQNIIFIVVC